MPRTFGDVQNLANSWQGSLPEMTINHIMNVFKGGSIISLEPTSAPTVRDVEQNSVWLTATISIYQDRVF
eukprot:12681145-Alexandrium_andersonii.AAC.1